MIRKIKKLYFKILQYFSPIKHAERIGVKIGKDCVLLGRPDFGTEPYLITLGDHVMITGGCSFITHEGGHWVLKGLDKSYEKVFGYGRITIGNNVYIGTRSTILRGVSIEDNVIVGARSLVNKSLPANGVYAGVPAKYICSLEEWKEKFIADMPDYNIDEYKKDKKKEVLRIVDSFKKR